MSNTMQTRGLCTLCNRDGSCTYQRGRGGSLMHCDEFSFDIPREQTAKQGEPGARKPAASPEPPREAGLPRGLCSTCENSRGCTFSKPPAGVWHCEEFV